MSITSAMSTLPGVGSPLRRSPVTNLERMYALDEAWNARDWDTFDAYHDQSDVHETETSGTALPNVGGFYYAPNAPGTAHFVVDRRRRTLIGCTITGSEVVDFLHAATIAVVGEIPLERLRHAVPPFPTRSELWLALLEQAGV